MCGIVGFIHCGDQVQLQAATQAMAHRGPDAQRTQWFDHLNLGLGHSRLSIIDLSELGNQPMYHPPSRRWIVFNGEIFNYLDIRNELKALGYGFSSDSDTEVVLVAFQHWGKKCLSRFNGMFAFAILDEVSGDLFIARDRLGIKPLYYWHQNGKLVFGSEIKAILQCKNYEVKPDLLAIHTPVHYQIGPNTGFEGIRKLPPGHILNYKNGQVETEQYWSLNASETQMPWADAIDRANEILLDSVRLQMISDVPVGSLLSGGLDSSLVSVLMQKLSGQTLNTFTIRFKAGDLKQQGNTDDAMYARRLAEEYGFRHHEIEIEPDIVTLLPKLIWHLDEPVSDPAAINTYLISKAARERGIIVLLSGMGADEVFGGYRSQLACLRADLYQSMLPKALRSSIEYMAKKLPEGNTERSFKYIRWFKRFSEFSSLPQFERYISSYNSALQPDIFREFYSDPPDFRSTPFYIRQLDRFEGSEGLSYLTRICLNDTSFYLPDHNLTYTDKAAMAAGVEVRPPLIDHRLTELMFSLPPEFRIKGKVQKSLLKAVAGLHIPAWVSARPKAPFSAPMRSWLKGDLKEMVDDLLSTRSLTNRGIYNPAFASNLIRQNQKGQRDNSQLIWRLMVNELWFRTFIDKS